MSCRRGRGRDRHRNRTGAARPCGRAPACRRGCRRTSSAPGREARGRGRGSPTGSARIQILSAPSRPGPRVSDGRNSPPAASARPSTPGRVSPWTPEPPRFPASESRSSSVITSNLEGAETPPTGSSPIRLIPVPLPLRLPSPYPPIPLSPYTFLAQFQAVTRSFSRRFVDARTTDDGARGGPCWRDPGSGSRPRMQHPRHPPSRRW